MKAAFTTGRISRSWMTFVMHPVSRCIYQRALFQKSNVEVSYSLIPVLLNYCRMYSKQLCFCIRIALFVCVEQCFWIFFYNCLHQINIIPNMVKQCKVPACKETSLSLFSVPKDQEERQKWIDILQCHLDAKSFICEQHFSQNDVKKNFTAQMSTGEVIYTVSFTYLTKRFHIP